MIALRTAYSSCPKITTNIGRFVVGGGNEMQRLRPAKLFHNSRVLTILPQQQQQQQYQQRCWFATNSSLKNANPNKLERVYIGSLASRMRAVKVFSLTTSLVGIAAQPILLEQGVKLGGTPMAVLLCGVGGFFTFITPLLLHFITKKYVTEVHYNPATEEYTATTISFLLRKIETKFRPEDVKIPEVPGMFTSFLVGKQALFVDPSLFENPEHYVRIMGYDKPIDFKLDLKESPTSSSSKVTTSESKK